MKHNVGIVVVSYNSANELKECVSKAQAAITKAGVDGNVVVVDNNSKDNSVKLCKSLKVECIANKDNRGFSIAVNQGIKRLFELEATDILILNPDAMMDKESLKFMMTDLDQNEDIGAVGPSMFDEGGKSTTGGYYLKAPSWYSVMFFSTFLRPFFIKRPFFVNHFYQETIHDESRTVEQIPGACLLVPRAVLEDIGLLDEDFAIWFEDVEWCYRARKNGYKLWFCAPAKVVHEGGVSFSKWQSLDKAVTFYVSMRTFFVKHKPVSSLLVQLVLIGNSLALYLKSRDKSNLVFIKRYLKQKKGVLPS